MDSEFYLQARREWDERYGDLVLGKRNWQIASAGLMLLTLILALGMIWVSAKTKVIPYIVEVAKLAMRSRSERAQRVEHAGNRRADEAIRDRRVHPQCALGLQRPGRGTEHAQ
jgi:type IV secretion system protein TrbF